MQIMQAMQCSTTKSAIMLRRLQAVNCRSKRTRFTQNTAASRSVCLAAYEYYCQHMQCTHLPACFVAAGPQSYTLHSMALLLYTLISALLPRISTLRNAGYQILVTAASWELPNCNIKSQSVSAAIGDPNPSCHVVNATEAAQVYMQPSLILRASNAAQRQTPHQMLNALQQKNGWKTQSLCHCLACGWCCDCLACPWLQHLLDAAIHFNQAIILEHMGWAIGQAFKLLPCLRVVL
jgi:hypothetical protein